MRVFIAFLMLIAGLGAYGQAVSRTELRNTNTLIDARMALKANTTTLVTVSNAILALATVTVPTIADLIALNPATNEVEVTSHHSTNGLGGGRFRLGGTNGFKTNEWSVFASTAPRKFWFRKDATPINPEWFGVEHNGSTDDQSPLQRFFNAHTNGNAVSLMPPGDYRHTDTLTLTNHQPGTSFRIVGSGAGRGPDGTRFLFAGSLGQTQMMFVGANNSSLEHLAVDGAGLAKVCIHIDSENVEKPGSPGSSKMQLRNLVIEETVGADSKGVSVGHATGSGDPQISEVLMDNVVFQGTTGSDHAFKNNSWGNTKNFYFLNCSFGFYTNNVHIIGGTSEVIFYQPTCGGSLTNFTIVGGNVTIIGLYGEADSYFGTFQTAGASPANVTIIGSEWHGITVNTDDEIMRLTGTATLMGNWLYNDRSATSLPKIAVNRAGGGIGTLRSEGNYYQRATVPPVYGVGGDGITDTNNWVFNREGAALYAHTNRPYSSRHDYGGEAGALLQFEDFSPGGGDLLLRYMEIMGNTMLAYSNAVSIGTNGRAGTFNLHGPAYANALGSNATVASFIARQSDGKIVETAAPSGGSGTPAITPFYRPNWTGIYTNFAIGSDTNIWIDMDRSYILSVTNVCNGCKVHVVLTNSGAYNYSWFNTAGTTNRIEWQNEVAPVSTSPATDAGLYSVYLIGTATNVMGWYYPPLGWARIVAYSAQFRGPVTNAAAVNNAAPVTNWNQVVGMSQFAGQASSDSFSSTNQNGKLFTLQSALIATNMTWLMPTNGWNGLTPPFFITISNLVGDGNGTTGQMTFVASADLATLAYAIAISNYVDTASSNRVRVAITGPAFATVAPTGSGGVETFTLTASAALGNWQGLTSHGYTNDVVNVFAAASVVTCDAAARTHIQTNRMTAAQTLVHTNFTVGQVSTEIIPGEAAGGTARVLTYAVVAGSLIRTNDSAFIASSGFGISVPAGYALEISAMQKSFLSTNVVDLKIAYQPQ